MIKLLCDNLQVGKCVEVGLPELILMVVFAEVFY
jgi:hypothetical protein